MEDDYSTRNDIEDDLKDINDTITEPIKDEIGKHINDQIQQKLADKLAQDTAKKAAEDVAANAANAATNAAAEGTMPAVTSGAAAESAAVATAGAGTTAAAGEAAVAAGGTMAGGTAAAAAGGGAIGSAGGPIGAIIGVLIGVLATAVANQVNISIDPNDPDAPKVPLPLIFLLIFLSFMMIFCGTLISKGISGIMSISQETEFQNTKYDGKGMSDAGTQFENGTDINKPYNDAQPLANSIRLYIYGKDDKGTTDGFRAALAKAIKGHCKTIVEQLDVKTLGVRGKPYRSDKSLKTFYDNPFPYDLADNGKVPLIGDFLNADGYEGGYLPRYDDVNYAEVFAILSMSANVKGSAYGFNWGNANFEDFMEFTKKEDFYKYLYELGLKWVSVYEGDKTVWVEKDGVSVPETHHYEMDCDSLGYGPFDSPEDCAAQSPETIEYDEITLTFTHYYVRVKVKPFGLRELYTIAFGDCNAAYSNHIEFDQHTNLEMLAYAEKVTRWYQRDFKMVIKTTPPKTVDALGPSYNLPRSTKSSIYNDLMNDSWLQSKSWHGTGRSAWYYIEKTYNDKFEEIEFPPPEPDVPDPDPEPPVVEEGKILDMYKYLNQGWYPDVKRGSSSSTVSKSGCLDCSVAMILMYYLRRDIPITEISKYVGKDEMLPTSTVLGDYGFRQGGNTYSDFTNGVINEINNDRPVIIHIRGYWQSVDGRVLHKSSNGHFLVGIGYDKNGLYVHDPGNKNNYLISYADWGHVGDLYYRPVYKK